MADTVAFVDSIASSPTTRLNLNDGTTWRTLRDGSDLSPPRMRRSVVGTLLADGDRIPAAAYENRIVRLALVLKASSADTAATQLQTLAKELNRAQNVLKWQPVGATSPVFFRTFRAGDPVVHTRRQGLVELTVDIPAEPFAYGLKETPVSASTVTNNPAAGSNGQFVDVSSIKGDVETPAIVSWPVTSAMADIKTVLAVRGHGTVASVPFLQQAESMTVGTDTSVQANDATMSGAGSNYVRCTFASGSALTTRVSVDQYPSTATTDARGTYRVFGRFRRSGSTDTITVQLRRDVAGGGQYNDEITTPLSTSAFLLDLGLIHIPGAPDPVVDGFSGVELPARRGLVGVRAARTSGTTNSLDIDYLLFVPADEELLISEWSADSSPLLYSKVVVDGANGTMYGADSSDDVIGTLLPSLAGGFPVLRPGVTNRLYFLRSVDAAGDSVSATTAVTVSYYPRYLYVRPASS